MGLRTTMAMERERERERVSGGGERERERESIGRIGWAMCISTIDYGKKTYTHHLSPWRVEFDDPRWRVIVIVRCVQEARVERGMGGHSITSFAFFIIGRGRLCLRVRKDDVLNDMSTGIDGGSDDAPTRTPTPTPTPTLPPSSW